MRSAPFSRGGPSQSWPRVPSASARPGQKLIKPRCTGSPQGAQNYIQRFLELQVVEALNTMNCEVMVISAATDARGRS